MSITLLICQICPTFLLIPCIHWWVLINAWYICMSVRFISAFRAMVNQLSHKYKCKPYSKIFMLHSKFIPPKGCILSAVIASILKWPFLHVLLEHAWKQAVSWGKVKHKTMTDEDSDNVHSQNLCYLLSRKWWWTFCIQKCTGKPQKMNNKPFIYVISLILLGQ